LLSYDDLMVFEDGGHQPCWIFENLNF